jgi:hypothetical protein
MEEREVGWVNVIYQTASSKGFAIANVAVCRGWGVEGKGDPASKYPVALEQELLLCMTA